MRVIICEDDYSQRTFIKNEITKYASFHLPSIEIALIAARAEDVVNFINQIMKWIRIFVPILLIGLGILDFTKATFSKSEDDMKKSREKFIKRIVAAVLVFLAPIFINLILELANSVWSWISPETCIK